MADDDFIVDTSEVINSIIIDEDNNIIQIPGESISVTSVGIQGPSGAIGPAGPAGPTGPAGSSGDINYIHTQSVPAATWTITHNLGKMPSVTIVDSADNVVMGEIQYINSNQLRVTFSSGFSGKAYLN